MIGTAAVSEGWGASTSVPSVDLYMSHKSTRIVAPMFLDVWLIDLHFLGFARTCVRLYESRYSHSHHNDLNIAEPVKLLVHIYFVEVKFLA